MTQKDFTKYFGIPIRTVEDWERGVGHMPNYVLRLFVYKLEIEKMISSHLKWSDYQRFKEQ